MFKKVKKSSQLLVKESEPDIKPSEEDIILEPSYWKAS